MYFSEENFASERERQYRNKDIFTQPLRSTNKKSLQEIKNSLQETKIKILTKRRAEFVLFTQQMIDWILKNPKKTNHNSEEFENFAKMYYIKLRHLNRIERFLKVDLTEDTAKEYKDRGQMKKNQFMAQQFNIERQIQSKKALLKKKNNNYKSRTNNNYNNYFRNRTLLAMPHTLNMKRGRAPNRGTFKILSNNSTPKAIHSNLTRNFTRNNNFNQLRSHKGNRFSKHIDL